MNRVWQSWTGWASPEQAAARTQLLGQAVVPGVGEIAALVRGAERDEGVHSLVTTEPRHVVAGDETAERGLMTWICS